ADNSCFRSAICANILCLSPGVHRSTGVQYHPHQPPGRSKVKQLTSIRKEVVVPENSVVQQEQAKAIRPFQKISFPDEQLAELRSRIKATRWPDRETVPDATQGVQLAITQALANYWATDYNWRKCESTLNALPQFITEIDGLDIHFIHVRSKHPNA